MQGQPIKAGQMEKASGKMERLVFGGQVKLN
jgi:hypothetical protein